MPTDRINPGASLLEAMRAMALDKARKRDPSSAAASIDPAKNESTGPSRTGGATELRQRLRTLLAPVDPDDDEAINRIREPALREVILWEFGDDFRQSANFHPMVTSISQAMDIDERFRAQFVAMIRSLKP